MMKQSLKLVAALLAGAAATAVAEPSNKQLVVGTTQEFENLNPLIAQMAATTYLSYMVDLPLVAIDADWRWQCWLCTSIPTTENGGAKIIDEAGTKKMLVTWQLKPEAAWGDGKPVTGNDVLVSWKIGADPAVSVGEKDLYERIEDVQLDPKDPKKFTLKFKEARYDYYQLGTFRILPAHIEGPIWEKTKGQTGAYEKQTAYNTDPLNPGLYNGPYVVKEIKLGSHVIVEKNPKFGGKAANIEKIVYKLIPNTQTLEANLVSGSLDMISELGMTFDQALAFEKRQKTDASLKKYAVLFNDGMTYEHIDVNLRNPLLQDVRVRKALMYGIDRDKLTAALFESRQKKALSWIHPKDIYYTEAVTKYDYDAAKATKLLEEAGYKKGADGIMAKDGKKLSLSLMTTAQNKTRELVQVFLQQEWKKIGIEITIQNEPARTFFGETVRKGSYPALAMFAWVSSPDNPPRTNLHSKEIPTDKNGFSGQNSGAYSNAKVDALLDQVKTEFDESKRKAEVAEVAKFYTDEVPVLPLYMRAEIAVIPTNLKGFKLTGHQFYSTLNVADWTVDAAPAH